MNPSLSEAEFERCWPWIAAGMACDLGGQAPYTKEQVWRLIESRQAYFWPGKAAANISDVYDVPAYKALNLWASGGDLKELITEILPSIEIWAAFNGFSYVGFSSPRKGWTKLLAKRGFTPQAITYAKELI